MTSANVYTWLVIRDISSISELLKRQDNLSSSNVVAKLGTLNDIKFSLKKVFRQRILTTKMSNFTCFTDFLHEILWNG